jgi:hypothetical protein
VLVQLAPLYARESSLGAMDLEWRTAALEKTVSGCLKDLTRLIELDAP